MIHIVFNSNLAEIDVFEAFNINSRTEGFKKVQGLGKETGDSYKIGKNIPRMAQSRQFLDKFQILLRNARRVAVIANVKVKHFSSGTLFSVESNGRGGLYGKYNVNVICLPWEHQRAPYEHIQR